MTPTPLPTQVMDRLKRLLPAGRFWLVGGCVRDIQMGRVPVDYDIAVMGNPADFAAELATALGRRAAAIGPKARRIHRIVDGSMVYDFSEMAGDGIVQDLARRDFTINAMALSPGDGGVIDPLGGRADLKAGLVRMVSTEIFDRDSIRLLRAFRLAATFGFHLEPVTEEKIESRARLIVECAGERVRDELFKLLAVERSEQTVRRMHRAKLLQEIFPELNPLQDCRQNGYHQFDVLEHTMQVLDRLESILATPSTWLPEHGLRASRAEACKNPAPLKLAALLHDIGKPAARQEQDGRIRFRGHSALGHRMAQKVFERLRLSNRHSSKIGLLIRQHIRPLQLFVARERGMPTRRGRTRFFLRGGETTPALLMLSVADMAGKRSAPGERFRAFCAFADELLGEYFETFRPRRTGPPLVTGRDLITSLGLAPSPLFGDILSRIESERLEGRLKTKEEGMRRARELLLQRSGARHDQ